MNLTREAAAHAQRDMAAPPPEMPMPCSAAAALEQAEHRARLRTPNHALVFARLTRAMRQTMALQAHIAAGHPPLCAIPRLVDPDRLPHATRTTTEIHPESSALRHDARERPDYTLPLGADGHVQIETLLATLRQEFGQVAVTLAPPDEHQTAPSPPDRPPPRPLLPGRPRAGRLIAVHREVDP